MKQNDTTKSDECKKTSVGDKRRNDDYEGEKDELGKSLIHYNELGDQDKNLKDLLNAKFFVECLALGCLC